MHAIVLENRRSYDRAIQQPHLKLGPAIHGGRHSLPRRPNPPLLDVTLGDLMEEPGGGFPVEGVAIPEQVRNVVSDFPRFEGGTASQADA